MKTIKAEFVKTNAVAGTVLEDCIFDAILMAVEERRTVIMTHNDRDFLIKPKELHELVWKTGSPDNT